jgi:hypothetical protein
MTEKICFCGHWETKHKYLDMTVDQIIQRVVHSGTLIPKYSPDLMLPEGYFLPGENNKFYPYEEIAAMIVTLGEKHSSCRRCSCSNFRADNLRYLEVCCERKASQIIH